MTNSEGWALLAMFLVTSFAVGFCVHEDKNKAKACLEKHDGKPYVEREIFAEIDGCRIDEVYKYDGKCRQVGFVYVSSCHQNLKWRESGKLGKDTSNIYEISP